jgi:hypothetical protein
LERACCSVPGRAPVADGFLVNDVVETKAHYPELWAKGDIARIVGLGTSAAPIQIRFERTGRAISTQGSHIQLAEGRQPKAIGLEPPSPQNQNPKVAAAAATATAKVP